jgi:hypothetical protein
MKMRNLIHLSIFFLGFACRDRGYDAVQILSSHDYERRLTAIAPFVVGKADNFSFEERFDAAQKTFYDNFIKIAEGKLKYFQEADTASLFFFTYRDRTSLYEHYRGVGGYFRTDVDGKIIFLNLLYHTPRLTKTEIEIKGKMLFDEMRVKGNVKHFIGKRDFIQTPNDDFYYNTKANRWDYTEKSSWRFLEEAKQRAQSDTSAN